MTKPRPPQHLPAAAKAVWRGLVVGDEGPAELLRLEFVAVQVARAREAQRLVDAEGVVAKGGPKGDVPVPHPAVGVERAAQEMVRKWVEGRRVAKEAAGDDADEPTGWVARLSTPVRHSA